jgi:hypothetical protein
LAPTESVDLNFINVWIQIHKLPIGYRNESLIKNLVEKKVGKCISVELNVQGIGNFVRVRVRLDVRLPLARVVTISREKQREFYAVKYEKIPRFCGFCGLLGHIHTECGTGNMMNRSLSGGILSKQILILGKEGLWRAVEVLGVAVDVIHLVEGGACMVVMQI